MTVPKVVRDALGLEEGDTVLFHVEGTVPCWRDARLPVARRFVARARCEAKRRLGRSDLQDPRHPCLQAPVSAFVDTNTLVRHLTGDPPDTAARATASLASVDELYLPDLVVAETVHVLESYHDVPRPRVAEAMRALVAFHRPGEDRRADRATQAIRVTVERLAAWCAQLREAESG